jgi:hypothetical protein
MPRRPAQATRKTSKKATPKAAAKTPTKPIPVRSAKKPKLKQPPDPVKAARRAALLKQARRALTPVAATLAIAALYVAGYRVAWNHVRETTAPAASPPLVLQDLPPWVRPDSEREIRAAVEPVPNVSPLDADALLDLRQKLSLEPWVETVHQVRREPDGEGGTVVIAEAEYRKPIALIADRGYFWFVDDEGVKLPLTYGIDGLPAVIEDGQGGAKVRQILGVAAPAPLLGQAWDGADVRAALAMEELITQQPWASLVRAIDVTNHGGRRDATAAQVVLWTVHDTAIRWGRAPGPDEDLLVETGVDRKLAQLELLWNRQSRRRLDYDGTPWVDVRLNITRYPHDATAALDRR